MELIKQMKYTRTIFTGLCLATVALSPLPTLAHNDGGHFHGNHESEHDHDQAFKAVREGKAMPLEQLLALVRVRFDGVVVHTRLEQENGVWMYELKIVDRNGRMREIYVNAKTGKLLNIEDD
jgi:uncharacterized membrane protein YkoI